MGKNDHKTGVVLFKQVKYAAVLGLTALTFVNALIRLLMK